MHVNPTDIVQSEQRDFSGNLLTARQHQPQKVWQVSAEDSPTHLNEKKNYLSSSTGAFWDFHTYKAQWMDTEHILLYYPEAKSLSLKHKATETCEINLL